MIHNKLLEPRSIVVVGGSNQISKPGGKLLKNLIDNNYQGMLYVVNPKETQVQGVPSFSSAEGLPEVDLAILAVPAEFCPKIVETLAVSKQTRGFIIVSAGFGETSEEGKKLEEQIVQSVNSVGGTLIGPNCIGIITPHHSGVFTTPVPRLWPHGCDFVSGSGASAVFIMESGIPKGLRFSNVWSVGNSAQTGVEDILAHLNETYDPETSPKVKLLYLETISNPDKLLHHATSLISKGCKIAAIKAGSSSAGSRAAQSHTGAMVSSDAAVEALLRKAGIVRCYGREELVTVANIFLCKELKSRKMAIITNAGGPGVMLTDTLENDGLFVPEITDSTAKQTLKEKLFFGSSVENPIDFLATGTAEQLGAIIDACEKDFDVGGMAIIYGSSGLFPVREVFKLLDRKMHECQKPIYPILPSLIETKEDVSMFLSGGNVNFPDEVLFGKALAKVMNTPPPSEKYIHLHEVDFPMVRRIVDKAGSGFQPPSVIHQLFNAAGIPRVKEIVADTEKDAVSAAREIGFPLVMKAVGPIHKTDVGGVVLNVRNEESVRKEFAHLMKTENATSVIIAQMAFGTELFVGAKYEPKFGHVILCGLGGIYVEVMKDVTSGLAPLTIEEAISMVQNLKSYKILQGYRGKKGVNVRHFAEIIVRVSNLLNSATEIKELDINPLIGQENVIFAVDARIRIEKNN
jgi:acetyltransferase